MSAQTWKMQLEVRGHRQALNALLDSAQKRAWIVAPFVTRAGINALEPALRRKLDVRLITRLTRRDMAMGSLDAEAIADAMQDGLQVRFAPADLHAKLWIVDDQAAIGSANLTAGGLDSNLECMVHAPTHGFETLPDYWFKRFWGDLGPGAERPIAFLRAEAATAAIHRHTYPLDEDLAPRPIRSEYQPGREAWLLVGMDEQRRLVDLRIGDEYAATHAGWGFPKGSGRPGLRAGDQVFIIEASVTAARVNDWSLVARAIVDVPYEPGIGDLPSWLLPELTETGRARAERWGGFIVWLRDLEAIATTYGDAPSAFDVLPNFVPTQSNRRRVNAAQVEALNSALENAFARVGVARSEDPAMWWSRYAINKKRYTLAYIRSRNANFT